MCGVTWASFIERAHPGDHGVQVYADLDDLAVSVGRFLSAGFRHGQPAIVIADPAHRRRFSEELVARAFDPTALQRDGRLVVRDAEETLAVLLEHDRPSPERFEQVIAGVLDETAARFPGKAIRVFGEMVDILWCRGRQDAAIALEELWNELAERRTFALLCGYRLDIFDIDVQAGGLPEILRTHSHARPSADPARLSAAVDRALAEAVGPVAAARTYLDVAERVPRGAVPRAQALLTWLSETDTTLASEVLERARMRYGPPGPSSS
jgi:hypothetical protein